MAKKPEIQYIGRFYIHGSEARQLAQQQKKKAKTTLPEEKRVQARKVYVDPLAICSLLMAMVLLVSMVTGAIYLQEAWHELDVAKEYVASLEKVNRQLTCNYRSGYDLEQVRQAALEMGMIPVEEMQTTAFTVTMPQVQPEPTVWENILWFAQGLFA